MRCDELIYHEVETQEKVACQVTAPPKSEKSNIVKSNCPIHAHPPAQQCR